jgi:hypothetical protein
VRSRWDVVELAGLVEGGKLNAATAPAISAATKIGKRRVIVASFSGLSSSPEDSRRTYDSRP